MPQAWCEIAAHIVIALGRGAMCRAHVLHKLQPCIFAEPRNMARFVVQPLGYVMLCKRRVSGIIGASQVSGTTVALGHAQVEDGSEVLHAGEVVALPHDSC